MSYILFYSNYCKFSEKYINILEKSGEANFFAKVCVDRDQASGQRPPVVSKYSIKEVPSIIVENKRLSGREAFAWLKLRIENSQEPTMNSVRSRDAKPQINQRTNVPDTVEPFSKGSGFSSNFTDSCLFIGDSTDNTIYTPETDEQIDKTSKYGLQDETGAIQTIGDSGKSSDSLKSKQLDNEYNKLLQERNKT